MYESFAGLNNDGYAIATDVGLWCRTLDETEFVDFLNDNSEKIQQSRIVHLHFRASTSVVAKPFIHLWKIGGYYCSHNGMMPELNRTGSNNVVWDDTLGWINRKTKKRAEIEPKCDSLEFFKMHEQDIATGKWQTVATSFGKYSGYGIILLTDMDNLRIVAGACGKPLKVLSDGELVVLSSSQTDIVEYKNICGLDLFTNSCTKYSTDILNQLLVWDVNAETYETYGVPHKKYTYYSAFDTAKDKESTHLYSNYLEDYYKV